jgi:hypothetical protein
VSRRKFDDLPKYHFEGMYVVRLVCSGQTKRKGGHKREVLARVARAVEGERVIWPDVGEVGGLEVEYGDGTRARQRTDHLRDTEAPHNTYPFDCTRCSLLVLMKESRLREVVDRAIALGVTEIPLDRRQ